jgi:hypothetical protein
VGGRFAVTAILTAASAVVWRLATTPVRFVVALGVIYASVWAAALIWSRTSSRIKFFSIVAVHLALFLVVALMEAPMLFRVVDYRDVFHTPSFFFPTRDPHYKQDPEVGYLAPPNLHQQGQTPGNIAVLYHVPDARTYPYDVQYDTRGFRNPATLDRADVAMVGDSFVHGVFVPQAELASSRLGELLGTSVYNLAQVGYGPLQEAAVVRRFALPLQPRVIVWVFYDGNDLRDISAFHEFQKDYAATVQKRHNIVARSFTRNVLAALGMLAGKAHESAVPRSALWHHGTSSERVYFLERAHDIDATEEVELEEFHDLLDGAATAAASQGAHMILAFAPTKFRVLHDMIELPENSDLTDWRLSDLPQRLADLAHGLSTPVPFVDLTPGLVDMARRGTLPYFADDTHWTPAGHDAVARELAAFITRELESTPPTRATSGTRPGPSSPAR